MHTVTVRDARPGDAAAIASVWSLAMPYLVRSDARAAADLSEDKVLRRRRLVGLLDGEVVGTATARPVGADEVFLTVEVMPEHGSTRVGTSLLRSLVADIPTPHALTSVCRGDAISMAFAIRNGFVPAGEHRVSRIDPAAAPPPGPVPPGLEAVTLASLVDLEPLLTAYNTAAADDPSGMSRHFTPEEFLADWWNSPDNAPDHSWALVDQRDSGPVVASFTSVQVDTVRGRAWSTMTATHPSHRGKGLARWVKARSLRSLAEAAVSEAWTANDATNEAMLAVNDALGYEFATTSVRVQRRLSH
jgi:RimJ/RimL family protein N-acetyltransferase/predicted N-acetyltransferase YhbS